MFDDPEYDPNLDYDPPMRHNTLTPLEVEGADDDPTTRVWTEIDVIDPLDPSLVPIIVRTSQDFETDDDDTDPISDILQPANESIEDGASSDIADQQDDPKSQQETLSPKGTLPLLFPCLSSPTCQVKDLEFKYSWRRFFGYFLSKVSFL